MAATASQPTTNGTNSNIRPPINSTALSKIVNLPLVNYPLTFAYNVVEGHAILARPYHFGEDVLKHSLNLAEPITSRFNGQLSYLDNQAVKALEFAESKFPYPFKATPQEVASLPLSVIQAYSEALQKAWNQRVQPGVDTASAKFEELKGQNQLLQKSADGLSQLVANLQKKLDQLKSSNKATADKASTEAKSIVSNIFDELEKVRAFSAHIPQEARARLDPLLSSLNQTYSHLNAEVREGSGPLLPRLQKVLTYVQEEALPAIRKAAVEGAQKDTGAKGPTTGAAKGPTTGAAKGPTVSGKPAAADASK